MNERDNEDCCNKSSSSSEASDPEAHTRELQEYIDQLTTLNAKLAPDGTILMVNASASHVEGRAASELVGRMIWELPQLGHSPRNQSRLREAVNEAASGKSPRFEVEHYKADGGQIVSDISIKPVRDEDGRVAYLVAEGRDITDRKLAEQMLLQQKALMETIINAVPGTFFLMDQQQRLLWWNEYSAQHFEEGPVEDGYATDIWTLQEDIPKRAEAIKQAFSSGYVAIELRLRHKDGSIHNYYFVARRVEIEGQPYVVGTGTDITELRESEEALRESEKRINALLNTTNESMLLADLDGNVLAANDTFAKAVGKSVAEVVGTNAFAYWPPETVQLRRAKAAEVMRSRKPVRFETERSGAIYDASVYPVLDSEGEVVAVAVYAKDITLQKRAEAVQREYEERLRLHIEQTPLAVIEWDVDFRVVHWNPAAERIFGYTAEEAMGQPASFIVPEAEKAHTDQVWAALMTRKGGTRSTNANITKDGRTIICEWYNTSLTTADGSVVGAASLAEDVTDRVRAEEEKRAFYSDALRSATQGKLEIITQQEAQAHLASAELRAPIRTHQDISLVRRQAEHFLRSSGLSGDELGLFVTGLGEAMTNALKHARVGLVSAGVDGDSVWAGVSDKGSGIDALSLPGATLRRGYSSKISMGMGYSIMLEVADRVRLCTGRSGTTVVLVKFVVGPRAELSLSELPDTW